MINFSNLFKQDNFEQVILRREEGKIYSADFGSGEGKYISKVFSSDEEPYDVSMKVSPRVEVRLTYIFNNKDINGIKISKVGGRKAESVTLSSFDSKALLGTLAMFAQMDLGAVAKESVLLDASIVKDDKALTEFLQTIAKDEKGSEVMSTVARNLSNLTPSYIQEVSRRRKNAAQMKRLLEDRAYFTAMKDKYKIGKPEEVWQRFLQANDWMLGADVIELLDNRALGEHDITDIPFRGVDGFLDIIELKLPTEDVWNKDGTPKASLTAAVMQCARYLRTAEQKANDAAKLKELGAAIIKPRITLVYGRSNTWTDEQKEQLRILNASLHDITILTYDHVLSRAEKIVSDGGKK